jgi:protein TonB
MSYAPALVDRRSLLSLSTVAALHLVALYVLQSGLSHAWVGTVSGPIQASLIDELKIEPKEPPPPPPQFQPIPVDVPPAPDIAIELPAESANTISAAVVGEASPVTTVPRTPIMIPPRLDRERSKIIPDYPLASKRLGEEGRVLVNVHILPNGSAGEVLVLKSSGFLRLDTAAVEHVRRDWRFVPARLDGEAVAAWGSFGVTFRITQ